MHDCQKFRENWIAGSSDGTACDACRVFCNEVDSVIKVLGFSTGPIPEDSDQYWSGFENRLRARLVEEQAAADRRALRYRWAFGFAAAASLAVVLTWGSLRLPSPVVEQAQAVEIEFDRGHIADLDPGVVDFLSESELFVRDFTKIEPSYEEDIEDARLRASRSLAGMPLLKRAAADFDPVRITLDEYESVLREIKNLDSSQDLADIQARIRRNGLIASLKAYQPRVVRVSHQR